MHVPLEQTPEPQESVVQRGMQWDELPPGQPGQ
jgi:hypothetical protein